jgi:hypothetical protein
MNGKATISVMKSLILKSWWRLRSLHKRQLREILITCYLTYSRRCLLR